MATVSASTIFFSPCAPKAPSATASPASMVPMIRNILCMSVACMKNPCDKCIQVQAFFRQNNASLLVKYFTARIFSYDKGPQFLVGEFTDQWPLFLFFFQALE